MEYRGGGAVTPRNKSKPRAQQKTRYWPNVDLMLGQRRRRWTSIKSALGQCPALSGMLLSQLLCANEAAAMVSVP